MRPFPAGLPGALWTKVRHSRIDCRDGQGSHRQHRSGSGSPMRGNLEGCRQGGGPVCGGGSGAHRPGDPVFLWSRSRWLGSFLWQKSSTFCRGSTFGSAKEGHRAPETDRLKQYTSSQMPCHFPLTVLAIPAGDEVTGMGSTIQVHTTFGFWMIYQL